MVTKGTSVSQELPPFSADPGHSAASSFPLELPVRTSGGGGGPAYEGDERPSGAYVSGDNEDSPDW